ncbi:MAG: hypothetical protein Q8Q58_09425, partial [Candidatus Rokubacteria bacterium]|nr:hypothetical protein [Candidatus Rokubacteria bacterium]
TLHVLRGGPHHRAGKRASSSSFSARTSRPFLVNFNRTVHVLAAGGAFLPEGRFGTLPAVPGRLLAEGFRRAVLEFLVNNDALPEGLRSPGAGAAVQARYEHLVRYVGWYSNRARGERAKEASPHAGAALPAPGLGAS